MLFRSPMRDDTLYSFDAADVAEFVAHITDGPEPAEAEVEAWLQKHYNGLDQALDKAFKDYVREHWQLLP